MSLRAKPSARSKPMPSVSKVSGVNLSCSEIISSPSTQRENAAFSGSPSPSAPSTRWSASSEKPRLCSFSRESSGTVLRSTGSFKSDSKFSRASGARRDSPSLTTGSKRAAPSSFGSKRGCTGRRPSLLGWKESRMRGANGVSRKRTVCLFSRARIVLTPSLLASDFGKLCPLKQACSRRSREESCSALSSFSPCPSASNVALKPVGTTQSSLP